MPVLDEVVKLRRKVADLLGFDTFADYVLDVKMAKDSKTVLAFLDDLLDKLKPVGEAERKKFLALKKEVHESHGWPVDDEFNLWDYRYYDRLWTERELALGGSRSPRSLRLTAVQTTRRSRSTSPLTRLCLPSWTFTASCSASSSTASPSSRAAEPGTRVSTPRRFLELTTRC